MSGSGRQIPLGRITHYQLMGARALLATDINRVLDAFVDKLFDRLSTELHPDIELLRYDSATGRAIEFEVWIPPGVSDETIDKVLNSPAHRLEFGRG